MDESSRVMLSTLIGATVGGVVGYLYLTDHGRRVRDQLEPTLDAISGELRQARETGAKLRQVVQEGEQTLHSLARDVGSEGGWRSTDVRRAES